MKPGTEVVKLSLGLCKNECNNNAALSCFIKLGKKAHLHCVQGSLMYPHPTLIPALRPGCTHDTDMSPGALKEGGSPVNPSLPCEDPSPDLQPVSHSSRVAITHWKASRTPCPRGWGWGLRATGLGDSPSVLGVSYALMSQLFSRWPLRGPPEPKREMERSGGEQ